MCRVINSSLMTAMAANATIVSITAFRAATAIAFTTGFAPASTTATAMATTMASTVTVMFHIIVILAILPGIIFLIFVFYCFLTGIAFPSLTICGYYLTEEGLHEGRVCSTRKEWCGHI